MGAERKSSTSTLNDRARRGVEAEFRSAAEARWGAGEVFLWRARRCLEALHLTLLAEQGVDLGALTDKGLEDLMKHDKARSAIPREVRDHIESVRKYGNTGAHFQAEGGVSEGSCVITATALCGVMQWFWTRDGAGVPPEQGAAFDALKDHDRRIPSPVELALERELSHSRTLAASLAQRPQGEADLSPRGAERGRRAVWALGVTLGVGVAFAGGRASCPSPEAAPVTTITQDPPPAPLPAPTPVSTPAPTLAPPPAPEGALDAGGVPARPLLDRCPNEMTLIEGGFCVTRAPVTQLAFRQCVNRRGGCERPVQNATGCNWLIGPSANSLSANCVPRAQAQAYCAWRYGAQAGLPTRAEWAMIRARRDVMLVRDTREWSADGPDNGLNARGEWQPTHGSYNWERAPVATGDRATSFRCVVRADGT